MKWRISMLLATLLLAVVACERLQPEPVVVTRVVTEVVTRVVTEAVTREVEGVPVDGCTLLTCSPQLAVRFGGSLPEQYRVRATAADGQAREVVCRPGTEVVQESDIAPGASSRCTEEGHAVFPGFTPERVTVTVEAEGVVRTGEFEPAYEVFRPNGPGCDPTCPVAEIEFSLE